jgi:hypothetical protein
LVELDHLDDLATALLPPATLAAATLTLALIRSRGSARWLTLAAVILLLATAAISVSINVPINTDQLTWSVLSPPPHWPSCYLRQQWCPCACPAPRSNSPARTSRQDPNTDCTTSGR